jgi:hypothetical protein
MGQLMQDTLPPHKLFHHYSELPYSQRVLFTCALLILGLGYLAALANVYYTYAGRAGGNPIMLSYEDIVVAYSGSGKGSIIESALSGPMASMLPPDERNAVLSWVRDGADHPTYDKAIKPVFDKRCMTCHNGTNPHLPNLSNYDGIQKVTATDSGQSMATLIRVSHIHLFGLTFIFFIMGFMFSHAYVRPVWLKCFVIAFPFAATTLDISSWYFIKLFHPVAFLVIAAGAMMATCFAFMWLTTMYQMWFYKPPQVILERLGGDIPSAAD